MLVMNSVACKPWVGHRHRKSKHMTELQMKLPRSDINHTGFSLATGNSSNEDMVPWTSGGGCTIQGPWPHAHLY